MSNNTDKFKTVLTDAEIPDSLQKRVADKLVTARVKLFLKNPFFGYLAIRLTLTPGDKWCPTAATNGKFFYYNHAFVDALKPEEVEFLIGHEVLHCVYEHMLREMGRDHQLWNSATDYAINLDLVNHNIGSLITTVGILYDTKYHEMSSEDIYAKLFEDFKEEMQKGLPQSSGDGEGDGRDGCTGRGKGKTGKPSLDDMLDKILDDILDPETSANKAKNGKGGANDGPAVLTDEEQAELRDEMREAVLNAAKNCGAGDIPMGVRRLIGELTNPKMDWRELLRAQLESTVLNDFSWMRTSRIGWSIDAVMPGMLVEKQIDIAVAIDTSGSISHDMVRDFLGEVQGIMDQFAQYKIHLWTFDTEIYNPQVFTSENLEDITQYSVQGGGGTMFEVNYDYMRKEGLLPERLVILTDGCPCGTWGDENYVDTIFVIHGNHEIEPPFGAVAYYDAEK